MQRGASAAFRQRVGEGFWVLGAVLAVLYGDHAYAQQPKPEDFPQVKIDSIDIGDYPRVRIFASYLDERLVPINLAQVETTTVQIRKDGGRPEDLLTFSRGAPPKGIKATSLPRGKAKRTVGVVILAPGYLASPLGAIVGNESVLIEMENQLRSGISKFLKSLPAGDKANVIWYGDDPYTYIPTEASLNELTNFADRYADCEKVIAEFRLRPGSVPEPKAGQTMRDLGREACGLVSGLDLLPGIIEARSKLTGHYPNLFGVRQLPTGVRPEYQRIEPTTARTIEPGPVLSEALKMAARAAGTVDQLAVVLLTDGRDGYLYAEADARGVAIRNVCPKIYSDPDAGVLKGKELEKAKQQVRELRNKCADDYVAAYVSAEQARFAESAAVWLGFASILGIRIHSVGIVSDINQNRDYELDRLRVLTVGSGGTYREADHPEELFEQIVTLAKELNDQIVVEMDSGLEPGETAAYQLHLVLESEHHHTSDPFEVTAPQIEAGVFPKLRHWSVLLQSKVGYTWYLVILIALLVIAAVLFLFLGIKIIKGIVAKLKKAGEAAAKQAVGGKR
ncbi:MAG: hypothetical protein HUU55_04200 [Myxococcales bacterium]|nr:hypothetical protein [Myxococcales bacterium]